MSAGALPACLALALERGNGQLWDIYALLLESSEESLREMQGDQLSAAYAALLLCARSATAGPAALPLSAVLKACGVKLQDAVRELGPAAARLERPVARVLGSSLPLARRLQLRELQQSYVLSTLLLKKANDLFVEYFVLPNGCNPIPGAAAAESAAAAAAASPELQSPLGFFWLLFSTARAALLPPQADLVTSFALLLACTHFLLRHMPEQHHRQPLTGATDTSAVAAAAASGSSGSSSDDDALLLAVAASHSAAAHADSVRQAALLLSRLAKEVLLPAVSSRQAAAEGEAAATEGGAGVGQDAGYVLIPCLFNTAGQPQPAAVAAVERYYRTVAADADLDAISFLTASTLSGSPAAGGAAAKPAAVAPDAAAAQAVPGAQAAAGTAASAEAHLAAAAALLDAGDPCPPIPMDVEKPQQAQQPAQQTQEAAASGAAPQPATLAIPAPQPAGPQDAGAAGMQAEAPDSDEEEIEPEACTPVSARQPSDMLLDAMAGFKTPSPAKMRKEWRQAVPLPLQTVLQVPPLPLQVPATPVSTAMSSTAWLRQTVAGLREGPSGSLQALLQAAGLDEAKLVCEGQSMAAAVFPDSSPAPLPGSLLATEQSAAAAHRSECLRLYWHALESLLTAETARQGATASTSAVPAALLGAPLFRRCVAACTCECVAASYRMVGLAFPAVLERLHVPAFDLCKLIELFVQQLPTLPRDLKRHMLSVEERCLESLAWQQGSSLYPALAAACCSRPRPQPGSPGSGVAASHSSLGAVGCAGGASSGREAAEAPRAAADAALEAAAGQAGSSARHGCGGGGAMTPRKRGHDELAAEGADVDADMAPAPGAEPQEPQEPTAEQRQRAPGMLQLRGPHPLPRQPQLGPAPDSPSHAQAQQLPLCFGAEAAAPVGDPSARTAVSDFLRKLLKLAALRLGDLLAHLDTQHADPHMLLSQAYTLVHHAVHEHTWLLYGRHLDQILLCCLYAICKLHQLPAMPFKAIACAYKLQPQARLDILQSVSMTPREATRLPLQPTGTGDLISFYNQVFMPHIRPLLHRLPEHRSLVAQSPPSVLHYLTPRLAHRQYHHHHHHQQQQQQQQQAGVHQPPGMAYSPASDAAALAASGGIPPPPSLAVLRSSRPPSLQTPGPHRWPASPARGLFGAPTRSASGGASASAVSRGMQLLSPGAWRITRGQTTALASPRTDKMAALRMGSESPTILGSAAAAASRPFAAAPPMSPATVQHMFRLAGSGGSDGSGSGALAAANLPMLLVAPSRQQPLVVAAPAVAAAAGSPAAAAAGRPVTAPPAVAAPPAAAAAAATPSAADAAVQQMFADAEAAAAASAAASAAAAADATTAAATAAPASQADGRAGSPPAENLPLLAEAALVAEEIERAEEEAAAAFSGLRQRNPSHPAAPAAASPVLAADSAGSPPLLHHQQQGQGQCQPMLQSPARRVLQLAAAPVM